ncbi:aminoacyltransferase, partial [Candidatus Falkowbacteria bacterium]|nr:aminoacyltransferase [Candidatus Falkowbacteria bacterium]
MKVIKIDDKEQLDSFVGAQQHSQFIQSWEWGEFQKAVSGNVWRLGVLDGDRLVASAKIIKKDLPMGKSYFYCGRGPVFDGGIWNEDAGVMMFEEIERLAKDEMAMFLRFDPYFDCHNEIARIAKGRPFFQGVDVQPSKTLIKDITPDEEELLKSMHQKTRYNIKLAEKKGVEVVEVGIEKFEDFWSLLDQTTG